MRVLLVALFILMVGCVSREGTEVIKRAAKKKRETKKEVSKEQSVAKEIAKRIDINPFLTKEEEGKLGSLYYDKDLGLKLSAIFYAPGHSRAVINGYILKEGDFIGNKEVKEINPDGVVLKKGKVTYTLRWASSN